MCGCQANSVVGSTSLSSTGNCSGDINSIKTARNKLITITVITTDDQLKQDYKDARTELEEMLKLSGTTCPDKDALKILLDYTNNEYAKYI